MSETFIIGGTIIFVVIIGILAVRDALKTPQNHLIMPRELTDKQADIALAATAKFLDIKGSQLTVNREKMKARYRALVKSIEAEQCKS